MNKRFKIFTLLALFIGLVQLNAQNYSPDKSLTYPVFLDQCINFKSKQEKEAWVVFFWAGWNSASLYAVNGVKALHTQYQNKPVRFVSVSVEKLRAKWEKDLQSTQMPWEHLLVSNEADYSFLKRAFPHNSLPGMFVVNPDGMIHRAMTEKELANLLASASAELPNRPYQSQPAVTSTSISDNTPAPVSTPPKETEASSPAPVATTTTSPAVNTPKPQPPASPAVDAWLTHTVKAGETLFALYRKYQVPVAEIKRINGLPNNNIQIGQVLKIKRQ